MKNDFIPVRTHDNSELGSLIYRGMRGMGGSPDGFQLRDMGGPPMPRSNLKISIQ